MNVQFLQSLSRINQILYKSAYNFEIEHCNGTPESAHQAGLSKLKNVEKLKEEFSKPQIYVNLATGKTTKCTEAQLISKFS
jgi:hypothetical protein